MHCAICGQAFTAYRSDARTCGPRCKKALQRGLKKARGANWTARDVTGHERWIVRPSRRDPAPAGAKGDIETEWPHGQLVKCRRFTWEAWKPGRVSWYCSLVETARSKGEIVVDVGFVYEVFTPQQLVKVS